MVNRSFKQVYFVTMRFESRNTHYAILHLYDHICAIFSQISS